MPEILLAPKERQALKALAHSLKPVVLLGNSGLSRAVIREIDRALLAHELIKVRVPGDDRDERDGLFAEIAEAVSAARVQSIGKLLVLFRPSPEPAAEQPVASRNAAIWSPKPAKDAQRDPRPVRPGKPSAPKRTTPDRREAESVNRGTPARLDPGAARRAAGKRNVVRRGGGRTR